MRNSRYIRELIARRAACWVALHRVTNEWADLPLYAEPHTAYAGDTIPAGAIIRYVYRCDVDWPNVEVGYYVQPSHSTLQ